MGEAPGGFLVDELRFSNLYHSVLGQGQPEGQWTPSGVWESTMAASTVAPSCSSRMPSPVLALTLRSFFSSYDDGSTIQ